MIEESVEKMNFQHIPSDSFRWNNLNKFAEIILTLL